MGRRGDCARALVRTDVLIEPLLHREKVRCGAIFEVCREGLSRERVVLHPH